MDIERKCAECGGAFAYWDGRSSTRCGECRRGRKRIKVRQAECVDCREVFSPPGQSGVLPQRCATCTKAYRREAGRQKMRNWREANPELVGAATKGRPKVERTTLACAQCNSPVIRRVSDVQRNKSVKVFCNATCRQLFGGVRPRRGTTKACVQCGESFYAQSSQAERRFCSTACHDEAQRAAQVDLVCPVCEKSFRLPRAQAKRAFVVTCSRACDANRRTTNGVGRYHNGRQVIRWSTGYLFLWEPDHPHAHRNGWVAEHRWVVEQRIGRYLRSDEHVHHINGVKDDNRSENLAVLEHGEHSSLTGRERQAAYLAMKTELEEFRRRFGELHNT